jgi:hypothetical protein
MATAANAFFRIVFIVLALALVNYWAYTFLA